MLQKSPWPIILASLALLQGCSTNAATMTTVDPGFGSVGTGATTTYGGLTLGVLQPPSSHDVGISFAPPNVVMSAKTPYLTTNSIDYLVTRENANDGEIFHVIGDQLNAGYSVHVPILRFRAGDYSIKAFMPDSPTPFGQAALHVTSDLLSR